MSVVAVVLDVETTGLCVAQNPGDLGRGGRVLEVGMVAVDAALEPVAEWSVVLGCVPADRSGCSALVRDMHDRSGLWGKCLASTVTPVEAATRGIAWLESIGVQRRSLPLTGSSVHTDREWLRGAGLADLDQWFTHRCADVSAVREFARMWWGDLPTGLTPRGRHRVIPDCLDTLDELRWQRTHVFRDQPLVPA